MRWDDGLTAEAEVHIRSTADRVWALVEDINLPSRFSAEFQGAAWIGGTTTLERGASFVGRNRHPKIGEWETTSTVVTLEPLRVFEWAVTDVDNPTATWRFELRADDPGSGVTLRQRVRVGPGENPLKWAIDATPDKEERIIERRLAELRANMVATLEGIRVLAETDH